MASIDLERIRDILLHIEGIPSNNGWVSVSTTEFFQPSDDYQITLLKQAGFVEVGTHYSDADLPRSVLITIQGHAYISAIRDDGIWKKTKDKLSTVGGSAALDVVKTLATEIAFKILLGN